MKPETLAVRARHTNDVTTGAVAPPIVLSTTFEREADGSTPRGFSYTRHNNPNRQALEHALATLEGGAQAAAFASGLAAIMAVLHALKPGDHVIFPRDIYIGARQLAETLYGRWGLHVSFVDLTDPANVERAWQAATRLVWVETPSNPHLHITDIEHVAELAHRAGARCVVDNTWATPVLQNPLKWGADMVMHSTTKYLGGHSDVLGGALITREADDFFQRVLDFQKLGGAVPSPFDCWLIQRNLPSLPYHVRAQTASAQAIAEFLSQHPKVAVVHYPGLASHPQHAVAAKQMTGGFGGMLSFEVQGGRAEAYAVINRLKLFRHATSLGSVESLIEHRASAEGPQTQAREGLLRVSVGLEHAEDLIADLQTALAD